MLTRRGVPCVRRIAQGPLGARKARLYGTFEAHGKFRLLTLTLFSWKGYTDNADCKF